jgi:hypothetical protein
MPSIEGLDPTFQAVGTFLFVAAVAIFSGWALVFGKKKSQQAETKEFSMTGQLADMSPVTKLVEGVGLLYQQQVRTNIALERLAVAAEQAVEGYQADREEQDREEEVERRVAERLAEEGVTRRRSPRKE